MYAEIAWVLVSSGTQVQPQVMLNPDYLPGYLSVSYDYGINHQEVFSGKGVLKIQKNRETLLYKT